LIGYKSSDYSGRSMMSSEVPAADSTAGAGPVPPGVVEGVPVSAPSSETVAAPASAPTEEEQKKQAAETRLTAAIEEVKAASEEAALVGVDVIGAFASLFEGNVPVPPALPEK
jgi:hypothetical protein